jgi:NADH dehydrogenase [ubiquinone] 1 alpha subcomplex assembly factor 5
LFSTSAIYREVYGNDDGTLPATFQIFYWIGWKPDPSQPRPLDPQKSDVSLKDLHKLEEVLDKHKRGTSEGE